MIDPREFGRLEAEVKALQGEVSAMRADIRELLELANKGRGGARTNVRLSVQAVGTISVAA